MRVFTLRAELTLPLPRDRVFEFFGDAGNLEAITPPNLRFEILTPRPIAMHPGALIDYRLRLYGVPFHWRTEIESWDPPTRFTDRQVKGPYLLWHHTHTFEEAGSGSTRVTDFVRYSVPFGGLVRSLFVRPQIDGIFRHRQRTISRLLLGRDLGQHPEIEHAEER